MPQALQFLIFDASADTDGLTVFDALACTQAGALPQVVAEAEAVLHWLHARFPHAHGPIDEGHRWDHDLQRASEGEWHTVGLSVSATAEVALAFQDRFIPED